ncbi:threonine--tRNA ligase 2, cytoplasmic isoform X2 [Prinia subflava]
MAAGAAEAAELRLARQERELRWLAAEVGRLKEPQELPCPGSASPELQRLRAENEKLRYRLLHLRRSLAAELGRAAPALPPAGGEEVSSAIPTDAVNQIKEEKKKENEAVNQHQNDLQCVPSFIEDRLKLYEALKKEHDALLAYRAANQSKSIKITLTDGETLEGESWKTTPYQLAVGISKMLASNAVIAKVNGELWDLDRPLEGDCTLELLTFDNEEAKTVYWHSSAHILGEAMEGYFGGCLCYGPPIENGFHYDMYIEDRNVSSTEFPLLENRCRSIIKEKQAFERLEVKKEILLDMFKYNKFKCRILNEKVKTPTTTVYRCGPLIDLCRGPHVRHTGKIKVLKIIKSSSTYWEGKSDMESLQRIYGISFPDNKMMKEWEKVQEEAKNRDHRKIGKEQELFFFHDLSPGSCFFLPRGAFLYNTLMDFIRGEYRRRNFTEVVSPNVFNSKLWEASGHWQHYSENMFSFEIEKETFALKPMNCPGHCLMFAHRPRSWRELPLRLADFGVLHRNELSGTLSGLTRVRRFQQDDAHIFCTMEQIEEEIKGCLDFLKSVYAVFGFTFQLHLSTRPENYLGDLEIWDHAEKQLQNSLNNFGEQWSLNPGDGAFYGPKIDIKIKDAIGRYHQCATIQLDFQLPIRFNLTYVGKDGDDKKRPVIIHRAILGSVERMIAILAENYGGK